MGSAVAEEEGRVEGVPTVSSSQALRLTARRSAVGRAMRDEAVVRMGSSWQEREAASMGRKPDRAPAAYGRGEDGKTPESHGFRGGGGGWGIRTPEGLHPTRFPSVRHRPLGESSRRSTRRQPRATRKEYIGTPIPGASPGWWDLSREAGCAASTPPGRTGGLQSAPFPGPSSGPPVPAVRPRAQGWGERGGVARGRFATGGRIG